MLVCRVLSKKTKPIISSTTTCLAAQFRAASSSSSSSLRAVVPQQHEDGFSRRSFSILSSFSSSINHNLLKESTRHRSAPFYHLRSFSSDSNPEESVPAKDDKDEDDTVPAKEDKYKDHTVPDDATKPKPTAVDADSTLESPDDSSDDAKDDDLSPEDLLKLVSEKDQLLDAKHKELQDMKDKVLRTYAEMENVMERTRREADNSKKFAIQNFAKKLLDVADNLGRASSVVKENFAKIDQSKDVAGAVPLLKTLLEGVDMTDKQLGEVFKKFGVEKYDPLDEQFDPHRHNAVFQVPDASKPPGIVAAVLKPGYMLYDRVIRPAEVGVTQAVESNEAEQGSEA